MNQDHGAHWAGDQRHDSQNIVLPSPQPGTNLKCISESSRTYRWPSHKAFLPLWGSCYSELKPGSCSIIVLHLYVHVHVHVHVIIHAWPWDKLKPHSCHNSIAPLCTCTSTCTLHTCTCIVNACACMACGYSTNVLGAAAAWTREGCWLHYKVLL